MQFAAWQDNQVIPGEAEDEADLQFEDLEGIFYMSEMICKDF